MTIHQNINLPLFSSQRLKYQTSSEMAALVPPTALLPPNSLAQRLHTSRSNRHLIIPQLDQAKKSHTPPSAFSTLQKKLCYTWDHLCVNLTLLAEAVSAWFWIVLCHYSRNEKITCYHLSFRKSIGKQLILTWRNQGILYLNNAPCKKQYIILIIN